MAQMTDPTSGTEFKLEYSTNGSDWTDLSGFATSVSGLDQSRMSGETYTADGDTAIITYGKREPIELTFRIVYGDLNAGGAILLEGLHANGTAATYRYSPNGGGTGTKMYTTTSGCKIINYVYPEVDAGDASPRAVSVTIKTPSLTVTTVGS